MEKCPPNPFVIVDDLCEYVDEQKIKLQELPDHVPVGEMPRHVDLIFSQYLVDKASPGARLTCVGIFAATEITTGDKMGSKGAPIPITVRQLEAIIRISESLAKMELRDDVNVEHVEEALNMFTVSTLDARNQNRGVGVDLFTDEEKN